MYMIDNIITSLVASFVISIATILVGYLVFRNEQKNKNKELDNKFKSVDKDVVKNDERLRKELNDRWSREDKRSDIIERDIRSLEQTQSRTSQDVLEAKLTLGHFERTLQELSDKMDLILTKLTEK